MQKQPILIFGGHPDDIEIGAGGTARKLAAMRREVIVCVSTIPEQYQIALRKKEAANAGKVLGAAKVLFLPVPLKKLGFNRETIGALDKLLAHYSPSAVFTHSLGDSHQDHLALTNSLLSAARRNDFSVFMYEQIIPGGVTTVPFRPHLFVDISAHIDDKIKAIETHKSQVKKYGENWIESIRGRAVMRGAQIGTKYAEAFEVVKIRESTNLLKYI
ncbi:MAG: PIG-L family deacetylase [Parcubacteria group bacterium]|nr:PIG-L family deacetylase [Parcubacteria group bacterium]